MTANPTASSLPGLIPVLAGLLSLALAGGCHGKKPSRDQEVKKLLTKAQEAMEHGEVSAAVARGRKAVKAKPDSVEAWNRLGLALEYRFYETGDDAFRDEALSAYGKATKLDPHCAVCLINEANILWAAGRKKEAAQRYRKALALVPRHPDADAMRRRIRLSQSAPAEGPEQKGDTK